MCFGSLLTVIADTKDVFEMAHSNEECRLSAKRCLPCEGGVARLDAAGATALLSQTPHWRIMNGPDRIQRDYRCRNFLDAISLFEAIAELAESEAHHPDLHLTRYRQVSIEIWTHAIAGLSENDFILAAKIDELLIRRERAV